MRPGPTEPGTPEGPVPKEGHGLLEKRRTLFDFVFVCTTRQAELHGPGIEPTPFAMKAQNLNYWSTGEVLEALSSDLRAEDPGQCPLNSQLVPLEFPALSTTRRMSELHYHTAPVGLGLTGPQSTSCLVFQ